MADNLPVASGGRAVAPRGPQRMRDDLPRLHELPIPDDVKPDKRWSPLMLEMAAHIGPAATLRFCDALGGREIRVSPHVDRRQFEGVLSDEEAARFTHAFSRERLNVPVASRAILAARRAPVLAAVRAGKLTIGEAAAICHTPRNYISQLVNRTTEGTDAAPIVALPSVRDPRQMDLLTLLDDSTTADSGTE